MVTSLGCSMVGGVSAVSMDVVSGNFVVLGAFSLKYIRIRHDEYRFPAKN